MTARKGLGIAFTAILVGLLALAGCAGGSRAFVADRSVYFTSPAPLATMSAPLTVSWQGPKRWGQEYALFVDLPPVSPGASLRDLSGASCRQSSSCEPTPLYLSSIGVYVTTADHVDVTTLPSARGIGSHEKDPIHVLTLVLMNDKGIRVGPGAWQVQFRA